MIYQGGIG